MNVLQRRLKATPRDDRETRARYECELVALYHHHPSLREPVLDAFEGFAMSFAVRMKRGEEPLDDLVQVARFGLLKALDRFDPTVGRSFTAYAAPTILGELRRHYRDTGWAVHVPRAQQELAQKVARAAREVEALGLEPTAAALAEHTGLSEEDIVEGRIARTSMRTSSLDKPIDSEDAEAVTVGERRGELDEGYAAVDDRATIAALTRDLPERDRAIIAMRYGAGMPQREIGRRVGISQMQVSRELRRIVAQLHAAAG